MPVFAGNTVKPNTTLAIETESNTSAASTFTAQINGNITPGNVSKVPVSSLLYSGSTTKIYAHFMPWFGVSYHMNVGYDSADPAQVNKQVTDMISRGIGGVVIDWYGPGNHENDTTLAMLQEAQSRNGAFQFAIMQDGGALAHCSNTAGCDITAQLISDLNYISSTYITSPAYIRWNGKPVVFYFGVLRYPIDWSRVRANTESDLQFVFQNSGAFTQSNSNGGFAWVQPSDATSTDPMSLNYLSDFYSAAQSVPSRLPVGAAYKGFNDALASWGSNRLIKQQCGQTWLDTFSKANSMWSTSDQLAWFQLVTWNDYEEATEIETGIDNCVSINSSVTGSALNWSITGDENTIDHYTVFISSDGQNLMSLGDFPAGVHATNLASFGFNPGAYSVFVKAVGKPSLLNHMSAVASYTVPPPPTVSVALPSNNGTVNTPIHVVASASGAGTVSALQIYLDGALVYHVYASSFDTTVTTAAGPHLLAVKAWDNFGNAGMQSLNVTAVTPVPTAITISQPASNVSVQGPIHVVASGTAPSGVAAMQIYLDNKLVYQVGSSSIDTTVAAAAGTHLIVVKLWDKQGNPYSQSIHTTVAAGVTLQSPTNGSATSTAVQVTGSAASATGIVAMQIYVDGSLIYRNGLSQVNTTVSVAPGTHLLALKAWDANGSAYMKTATITAN
ncbi:MAG TPA: Ig-like domain-containing protein [Terriglobales bacterium]|nr:Ig-like domain-containing protein [Terriglobales bacterium]